MSTFKYSLISNHESYRDPLHEVAQAAENAGVDYFQLRDKKAGKRELLSLARHVRPFLDRTKLIVNGHLDVALASGADGVHLQRDNIPVATVRALYPELIIGYSAHSREEMLNAQASGASYVFISPVFDGQS